jgi:hypothetical protein
MNIYCVYLTTYKGNKLPPFYIGSSSVEKVQKGYHGSVCSKQFRDIWKSEIRKNPNLFQTKIISTHSDRKEATLRERDLQKKLSAVKNPLYTNQSFAAYDSFTDRDQSGKNNPMYGSSRKGIENPFYGQKHKLETLAKMKGRKCSEKNKELYRKLKTGISQSEETKLKKSIIKKGKPPNSIKILKEVSKEKFLCSIDTKKEYTYVNACQRFPDIKHLFWSKKISSKYLSQISPSAQHLIPNFQN